jgi:phosphopantothenate synthetase
MLTWKEHQEDQVRQTTGEHLMSLKYDVASVLERETQVTISNWYGLVDAEPELRMIPLSRGDRCRHLPAMFRELVSRLRNPLSSAAARDHGRLRRDQGYTAAMLVEESRILQVSIFQTLQMHVEDTQSGVLLMYIMMIADEVDSQLAQAMQSYISEAKLDAQPVEA